MKTCSVPTRITLLWFIAGLFSPAFADSEYIAVVNPSSGDLTILRDSTVYLDFEYYDWGPDWSGVARKTTVQETNGRAAFEFANTLQRTGAAFAIQGSWSATAENVIAFEATLLPEDDSALVLSQFGLNTGSAFEGTTATVKRADGTTESVALPFGRGSLGEDVTELRLTDRHGNNTTLRFEAPTYVPTDRQARLAIAHGSFSAGESENLAFTLELPAPTAFVPGLKAAQAFSNGNDWYPFNAPSPIPADSEWRMSGWLETPAGKHGRIARQADQLIYNGKPIQLWGLNVSYIACAPDKELADRRADFYAAMGVNSVRLHKYADGTGWAGILTQESATEFDPQDLDRMDYFVHALKERGIYTKLSPVFIIDIGPADRDRIPYMDELGPMRGHRINPRHGSLYLSVELQDLLVEQVTKLLDHTNPYTGLRYADDPAIAYVELYNEDSALFGGVSSVMATSPTLRARGGAMFASWLKNKYPTEEAWLDAWGERAVNCSILSNQKLPLDESWEENRIYPAGNPWFFDPDNLNTSQKAFERRLLDTMAFLYELQNHVYARYAQAVRETGYAGELIASNWQAGRMMSHFYNLHSDSLLGTIDRHNYAGGGGGGLGAFSSGSMLSSAGSDTLSSSLQIVDQRPFMLSEWIHVFPNEWGVEGPAIIGAYGMGLQGWDVSYSFQNSDNGTFSSSIGEAWDATAPHFIGIFPAVSRQVLRRDVSESQIVHYRNVHLPSLDQQQIGFDENVQQNWDIKTFTSDAFPAAAIAAAKGVVRFTDAFTPTEPFDLSTYRDASAIRASTGQLVWHEGESPMDGFIEIDTPATQALVGFAEGHLAEFGDSKLRLDSRFGAVYLSARSPQGTLAAEKAILLTAIARSRNEGQVVVADSFLMSRGEVRNHRPTGPVVMEPVRATIQLLRPGNPTVHLLDHGGVKTGRTLPVRNGSFHIDTGRDGTPYYLIEY